jgi:hemerythrin-like domain-containing protein
MNHKGLAIIRQEHAALAAMLQSMQMLATSGPQEEPERFFDVLRAMLFYVDEFPERLHHPKESRLLFPRIAAHVPACAEVIARLERDHASSQLAVRELQHLLLGWELLGESRRARFTEALSAFIDFYLTHMHTEEHDVLPHAEKSLTDAEWAEVNAAFEGNQDPLSNKGVADATYARLFTRIVMTAPEPLGLGGATRHSH